MSDERQVQNTRGVILWYRAQERGGALETDEGHHYRFLTDDPQSFRKQQRVLVRIDPDAERVEEMVVPRPLPGAAPAPPPSRPRARTTSAEQRRQADIAATGKGEALLRGAPVSHPEWGSGFVVMSTSTLARVRFMPSGTERSVRVTDLTVLEK